MAMNAKGIEPLLNNHVRPMWICGRASVSVSDCESQKNEGRSPHLSTLIKIKELNELIELHSQPMTFFASD